MRWPLCFRAELDMLERRRVGEGQRHEARIADLKATIAYQDTQHEALLEKYHELATAALPGGQHHSMGNGKPDTATTSTLALNTLTPPQPPTPKPRSAVSRAIHDEAGTDTRLATHLRKRADELKSDGKTDDEIAEELRSWQTTELDGI